MHDDVDTKKLNIIELKSFVEDMKCEVPTSAYFKDDLCISMVELLHRHEQHNSLVVDPTMSEADRRKLLECDKAEKEIRELQAKLGRLGTEADIEHTRNDCEVLRLSSIVYHPSLRRRCCLLFRQR